MIGDAFLQCNTVLSDEKPCIVELQSKLEHINIVFVLFWSTKYETATPLWMGASAVYHASPRAGYLS